MNATFFRIVSLLFTSWDGFPKHFQRPVDSPYTRLPAYLAPHFYQTKDFRDRNEKHHYTKRDTLYSSNALNILLVELFWVTNYFLVLFSRSGSHKVRIFSDGDSSVATHYWLRAFFRRSNSRMVFRFLLFYILTSLHMAE